MKKVFLTLLASLCILQALVLPTASLAADVNCEFKDFGSSFDCVKQIGTNSGVTETDPVKVILNIMKVALTLVGIIAVIALIISGVRYIMSAGDEGDAKKAKNGIIYAVIGLIIIGASILIVNLIIDALGGGAAGGGGGGGGGDTPISSDEPIHSYNPVAL